MLEIYLVHIGTGENAKKWRRKMRGGERPGIVPNSQILSLFLAFTEIRFCILMLSEFMWFQSWNSKEGVHTDLLLGLPSATWLTVIFLSIKVIEDFFLFFDEEIHKSSLLWQFGLDYSSKLFSWSLFVCLAYTCQLNIKRTEKYSKPMCW